MYNILSCSNIDNNANFHQAENCLSLIYAVLKKPHAQNHQTQDVDTNIE